MASIPLYHKLYPHKNIPEIISNPPHKDLVDFPHATFATFFHASSPAALGGTAGPPNTPVAP